ncbi:hypothetical protein CK203_116611 [Vitis vinifera]|uniref:Endonuclease/exonuclease/phosphatase domain-containing protein n=1 Tax=Vitis vinifera TaxID=29760 RepID=A0A438DRW3_VITVI|nr:hypothetical protein CK203_116611 [Vitis vinifera]
MIGCCEMEVGVYGPTVKVEREDFLSELGAIRGLWNELWCVAGDFNMIRFPFERSRGAIQVVLAKPVSDHSSIGCCEMEVGVYGPTVKVEREDFLSELGAITGLWNEPWCVAGDFNMIRFPFERSRGAIQVVLAKPVSDHSSILLDGGGMRRGPMPFRSENMWLKEEGFKEVLKKWWEGIQVSGSTNFILTEKLKALKPIMRS